MAQAGLRVTRRGVRPRGWPLPEGSDPRRGSPCCYRERCRDQDARHGYDRLIGAARDVIHILPSTSRSAVEAATTIDVRDAPRAKGQRSTGGAVDGVIFRGGTTVCRDAQERSLLCKDGRREDPLLRAAERADRAGTRASGGVGRIPALFACLRPT